MKTFKNIIEWVYNTLISDRFFLILLLANLLKGLLWTPLDKVDYGTLSFMVLLKLWEENWKFNKEKQQG